jgi:hypothetical protein
MACPARLKFCGVLLVVENLAIYKAIQLLQGKLAADLESPDGANGKY